MITETACFTGHRHLPADILDTVSFSLDCAISEAYKIGYRRFICGGALGFDTLAALRVIEFRKTNTDVRLILAIPCGDQSIRWPKYDQNIYRYICRQADERIILSTEYYPGCMQKRNRYMVEHSSLCICYLYSFRGGTAYTVRYAASRNINIINLAIDHHNRPEMTLREDPCCYMFISHSAKRNVGIAHLRLLKGRNLRQKDTWSSC